MFSEKEEKHHGADKKRAREVTTVISVEGLVGV